MHTPAREPLGRAHPPAGSQAYGFWFRLDDFPDGPSFSPTICPKHSPLGGFHNNVAHSNMFYGLRVSCLLPGRL